MLDMPRQRDYRKMLSPPYSRRAVASLEEEIRTAVRELLAPHLSTGEIDVYRDLAVPLATRVIADLIGIPLDQALHLQALVEKNFSRHPGQVGASDENNQALGELMVGLVELIEARRSDSNASGDDHIAVMLRTPAEGGPMTTGAIVSAVFTMLVTGIEVVPLSVANTAFYLAQQPGQRRMLVDDPSLIPYAFAESLRFDQPTNLLGRTVKEDVLMRGQKLRAGQGVMFLWASGNRDEEEFVDADRFDISRRPRRSLSFGHGRHKCIGEHIGNLEGRIILEELLAAAPEYEVREGASRAYTEFLHGYTQMPIEFAATGR